MASIRWVKAYAECRPEALFADLATRVGDVDVRDFNALPGPARCVFASEHEAVISVRRDDPDPRMFVKFELEGRRIVVHRTNVMGIDIEGGSFTGVPVLQPDGSCMLEVDGRPLELWQFSRMALQPLFFPEVGG